MNKQALREKILEMRRGLTSKYIEDASDKIYEIVIGLSEVQQAKTVMIYSNFDNEVKTAKLTGWLLFHGKSVLLPTIHEGKIVATNIKSTPLEMNGFGVTQPVYNKDAVVCAEDIDLIVMPGIVFDGEKNRLGFGKGFYDTYLKEARAAKKIALAYDFQIVDMVPSDEHDVPVDLIITPDGIIK